MLLTLIFFTLVVSLLIIFFLPRYNYQALRFFSILGPAIILILSAVLLISFDTNSYYFQYLVTYELNFSLINFSCSFGLDGLSVLFFLLSNFLIFLCIIFVWNEPLLKDYIINLLIIDLLLLLIFSALDIFIFYIFFEAILIPMFMIIGVWGSRERKVHAVYLFFFYTLSTSLLMLLGIVYIFTTTGTLNVEHILTWNFTFEEQCALWLSFFFSFASKIPMFPFHIWLPEAHVEAPTVGSVLLAGILLKLGIYGFLRFSLPLFPEASLFFSPIIYLLSCIGIIYASLTATRQTDLKRIIAYSSVAHMNLVTLGVFSFNSVGIQGSILQSVSHGFVSGAMFFLIGILYSRYHSRLLFYFAGLVHVMPLYSVLFLIFTMANIALPGTSSFIGEFLILCGVFTINPIFCFFSSLGVILCGSYSLWLYNKVVFGNLKLTYVNLFYDLTFREFSVLFPLLFFVFFMGMYPSFFSNITTFSVLNISLITLY